MNKKQRIVIIGCGPKALAIYSKAKVLEELGYTGLPEIVIIEKYEIGANWSGNHGYTDGSFDLGTSPLKDIGYPYTSIFGRNVDRLMERYSFINYMKEKNTFTAWVDGHNHPIPHNEFNLYLKWASKILGIKPLVGEVTCVTQENNKWNLVYTHNNQESVLSCDSIIITGPGDALRDQNFIDLKNVYDTKTFWSNIEVFKNIKNEKIALVGSGTSASAIFERLMPILGESSFVDWHTRKGIFSRSEHFNNNQIYTHADQWEKIPLCFRDEYALHTDRSVIEANTHKVMARYSQKFKVVFDRLDVAKYDKIIFGTGFNSMSFLKLLPEDFKKLNNLNCSEKELLDRIENDLSINNLIPKIYVPMLGWYKYGVGLRGLSCLSTLSDKVLKPYCSK